MSYKLQVQTEQHKAIEYKAINIVKIKPYKANAFTLQSTELDKRIVLGAQMYELNYCLSSVNRDLSDETVRSKLMKIL